MLESGMSYTALMQQASKTADNYLLQAIESVENRMGPGAAENFPQIVAAVINAAAMDYHAAMFSHRLAPALQDVGESIRTAGESARTIGDSIESAGQAIADGLTE